MSAKKEVARMNPPVSFNQDAFLVSEELDRNERRRTAGQNRVLSLEFCGPLSEEYVGEALGAIVRFHPALRAGFARNDAVDGIERKSRMAVFADRRLTHPGLYCRLTAPEDTVWTIKSFNKDWPLDGGARGLLASDILRAFDYSSPPLLRARLLRVHDRKHILVLVAPVIICDFWSLGVFHWDIARFYGDSDASSVTTFAPQPSLFDEFVREQYLSARTGGFDSDVRYWRKQWERGQAVQTCLRDLDSQVGEDFGVEGAELRLQLSAKDSARIREFAATRNIGLDSLVLAACCSWLGHAQERERVWLRVEFPNRQAKKYRGVVGWFSNCHRIVVDVPRAIGLRELARDVDHTLRASERHQAVPPPFLYNRLGRPGRADLTVSFTFISIVGFPGVTTRDGITINRVPLPGVDLPRISGGLQLFGVDQNDGLSLWIKASKWIGATAIRELSDYLRNSLTELPE